MASPDLIWELVKNNNAFLVHKPLGVFSCEPGNLNNKHCKRYSGLAYHRVVDIQGVKNKGVAVTIRKTKVKKPAKKPGEAQKPVKVMLPLANKPGIMASRELLWKGGYRRVHRIIRTKVVHYRPDLVRAALRRHALLYIASHTPAVAPKRHPRHRITKKAVPAATPAAVKTEAKPAKKAPKQKKAPAS